MEKVAIVILNWNGQAMLEKYLPSVMQYSRAEATVYVADNASTDQSLEMLKTHFPEVRQICLEKNWGFAEGYNQALRQVDATYYLLLNSDIEVTHHWLTPMIEYLDSHPEVAACQPKLLSIIDKDRFEYAGASGGYLDRLGYPFCRGRIFETVEADNGQYDYSTDILWGRIVCLPESYVYHVGGGTLPKGNPMKTFLNFRNNLTMLYKCLPDEELKSVMRWRWWLDYLAAWEMLLLKRNVGDFKAVYRARRAFKRWQKDFEPDRRAIQASRVAKEIPERRSFSLLWQYYVKGRKMFTQLP